MKTEKINLTLANGEKIICSKAGNGPRIGFIVGGPGSFYFNGLSCLEDEYTFYTYDAAWTYRKTDSLEEKKIAEITKETMIETDHLVVMALKEELGVEEVDGFGFSAPGALLFQQALHYPDDFSHLFGTGIGLTELDPTFAKTNALFYNLATKERTEAFEEHQSNYKHFKNSLDQDSPDESRAFFDVKPKTKTPLKPHKQFVAETISMGPKFLFNFSDANTTRNTIIEHWKRNPFREHIDKRMQEHFFNTIYPQLNPLADLSQLVEQGKKLLLIYGDSDFITPLPDEISKELHSEPNIQLKIFKECGHMPYQESPEQYSELVREYANVKSESSAKYG